MKKWILRLLVAWMCLTGLGLLSLNLLSGTGDAQKKGLEGAFSQIFQGKATIGKLNKFNVIPQFIVDVASLDVAVKNGGTIKADHFSASFSSLDLMKKNSRIEDISITNMAVEKGVWGPAALKIDSLGLKNGERQEDGELFIHASLDQQPIDATITLESFAANRPSFGLRSKNPFRITSGPVVTTGEITPYKTDYKAFGALHLEAFAQKCALNEDVTMDGGTFLDAVIMPQSLLQNGQAFEQYCAQLQKLRASNK